MSSVPLPIGKPPSSHLMHQIKQRGLKLFYTCAVNVLEALDIDPEEEDKSKKGWCQIRMMFEYDDHQALQTLLDNNTIIPEDQHTPIRALNTMKTIIKEDKHFWH